MQESMNKNKQQLTLLGGALCLLYAVRQQSWTRLALGALGAGLVYRGLNGRSLLNKSNGGQAAVTYRTLPNKLEVKQTITVNATPEEAYQFWRNLEKLPDFMSHLESVKVQEDGQTHWVAKAPGGISLEWDAEIVEEQPNERIRWRTVPGAIIQHAGQVHFAAAPSGRGTEVTVLFRYDPPGGAIGEAFAQLTNAVTEQQIREEVRRFKYMLESGEVPTIEGQPSAKM